MTSVSASVSAVRSRVSARVAVLALGAFVLASAAVRTWAAARHAGPAYFPDEYLYAALGRSIAATGHADVRGAPSHFLPILAPLVTAPAWLAGTVAEGYRLVHAINAIVVSLAAVPAYMLARTLRLDRRAALGAAALTLLVPQLLYASFVLSEPIAYPLVLAAVAAAVRTLARPTRANVAATTGFVLLATFTRLQFAILLPCILVAAAAVLVREQRVRTTLRSHWRLGALLLVATAGLAIAGPARDTGYYPSFLHVGLSVSATAQSLALNALIIVIGSGFVLVPGAILGAVAGIKAPQDRAELAFSCLAPIVTLALLLQASVYGDIDVAQTRYTFYLVPLWVISFLLYARRGWPWRREAAFLSLGLVTAALTTPLTTAAIGHGKIHAPELFAAARFEAAFKGDAGNASLAVVLPLIVLAALVAAAAAVRPRLAAAVALAAAAAVMTALGVGAYSFDGNDTHNVVQTFAGNDPSWVDALALGHVPLVTLPGATKTDTLEQMFWNRTVDREIRLPGTPVTDTFPAENARVAADGTILVGGKPVTSPALFDEYSSSVDLRGARPLGRGPTTTLFTTHGKPFRLRLIALGQYSGGWLGNHGTFLLWPEKRGGLVSGDIVLHLQAQAGGAPVKLAVRVGGRTIVNRIAPGRSTVVRIPVCARGVTAAGFVATTTGSIGDGRYVAARSPVVPRFAPGTCGRTS